MRAQCEAAGALLCRQWMSWLYPASLALLSLLVAALEFLRPWRPQQPQVRTALLSDVVHLLINGHWLGVGLYAVAAATLQPALGSLLSAAHLQGFAQLKVASAWPVAVQVVVALVVVDFLQWGVHNLLHRVGFLWEVHKVHHSITDGEMDWIVSFRFHWLEVVLYKALLYVPLLPFGFGFEALMFHAIFGTLIGHLNHANLNITWGPLRYVLNSPRMHIWHHNADVFGKATRNFGIIFSTWDWLFGTAYLPDHAPARLGYDGVLGMPNHVLAHAVWPASEARGPRTTASMMAMALFVAVLAVPVVVPRVFAAWAGPRPVALDAPMAPGIAAGVAAGITPGIAPGIAPGIGAVGPGTHP